MALSIASTNATAHRIRYGVGGTGGAATLNRAQADVVSDCAEGPLKQLLSSITTDAAWTALNNDPRITLIATPRGQVADADLGVTFIISSGRRLGFGTTAGVSGEYSVDVVFNHSLVV